MNTLSFRTNSDNGLSFELLVDGQPLAQLIGSRDTAIPYWLIDNGLPPDPLPATGSNHTRHMVAVCSCGDPGCGAAECTVSRQGDTITFSAFDGDVSGKDALFSFPLAASYFGELSMPTLPLTIRPYVATDWPQLCTIHDAARLDELRLTTGTDAFLSLEQTAESEGLFDAQLDVAEHDERVVGFIAYNPAEVTWLYVEPSMYQQGIGRQLLRQALAQAEPGMTVEVLEGNNPALQLYLSEGFTVRQRIEGRLEGNEGFAAVGLVLEWHPPE